MSSVEIEKTPARPKRGPARQVRAAEERQLILDYGLPEFLFKLADPRQLRAAMTDEWPRFRHD